MKKRHQHFIPRTYLKHFKNSTESEQVNVYNKVEEKHVNSIGINEYVLKKIFIH